MKWRVGLLFGFVFLSLVVVGTVAAGGPYWVVNDAPLYESASDAFPAIDSQGEEVVIKAGEMVTTTILVENWAQLDSPYKDLWVDGYNLSRKAPPVPQAVLDEQPVGNMSRKEFREWLREELLAVSAPAAQVPAGSSAASAAPAPVALTYTVKTGDSLSSIGKALGVPWQDLARANKIVSPYTIEVGQVLVVPSGATVAAPVAPAPVVSTTVSGWPTTAEAFLALATAGQPVSDGSWRSIELGEIHRAVGEPNSWAITREKDANNVIIPFWVNNFTSKKQDGYCQAPDGKYATGTPAGFRGLSQGVTFRP